MTELTDEQCDEIAYAVVPNWNGRFMVTDLYKIMRETHRRASERMIDESAQAPRDADLLPCPFCGETDVSVSLRDAAVSRGLSTQAPPESAGSHSPNQEVL